MKNTAAILSVRSVPPKVVVLTAFASYVGIIVGHSSHWPLWATVGAAIPPWFLLFLSETRWMWQNYGWLALFYGLVITQGAHFLEHLVQMIQLHFLGRSGEAARGVFGQLDIEWVHLGWNTWVLLALVLLARPFAHNPWLIASIAAAAWHETEHIYIITQYLSDSGRAGDPGLLAAGGAVLGGLPLRRPDLHFLYNVVETVPIIIAFGWELRRVHSEATGAPGDHPCFHAA